MSIDILVKIYNKWGEDNNIKNLGCAEEMLFWDSNLTDSQCDWLERFVKIWDKLQTKKKGKK